jgi:hypothetical protein
MKLEREIQDSISTNESLSNGSNIMAIKFNQNHMLGALYAWIVACAAISFSQNRKFFIAEDDDWQLVPNGAGGRKNWHFYFDSFPSKKSSGLIRLISLPRKIFKRSRYKLFSGFAKFYIKIFSQSRLFNNFSSEITYIRVGDDLEKKLGSPFSPGSEWAQVPEFIEKVFSNYNFNQSERNSIWKSYLAREIFRPSAIYLQNYKDHRINLPQQYIACHCRMGDKIAGKRKEADHVATEIYLQAVIEASKNVGTNNIFLLSDSDDFISNFIAADKLMGSHLNILFDKTEIRHDGFPSKLWDGILPNDDSVVLNEMTTALKNLIIMAESDILVGSKASWFFQVAHRLRVTSEDLSGSTVLVQSGKEIWGSDYWHF